MARCDAREDGSRQECLAPDLRTGGNHGQRTRGGNAERMHGLTDEVLAQHGPHGGQSIAGAGPGRAARALQLHIAQHAVAVAQFAQQQRAPIAQRGNEVRELMAGVGLCDGPCIFGELSAGEDLLRNGADHRGVEAKLTRQRVVPGQQRRCWHRSRLHVGVEGRRQRGVGVLESESHAMSVQRRASQVGARLRMYLANVDCDRRVSRAGSVIEKPFPLSRKDVMKTLALALLVPLAFCAACSKKEEPVAPPAPAADTAPTAQATGGATAAGNTAAVLRPQLPNPQRARPPRMCISSPQPAAR